MSHNHCNSSSCQHKEHHEGSSSGKKCSCCCGCGCCCCKGKCHCCCCSQGECDFSKELIHMADEAWMEVLKEKIKEQIRSSSGENLDQLAKLISDTNKMRWKNKMIAKSHKEDFHDKIGNFFRKE